MTEQSKGHPCRNCGKDRGIRYPTKHTKVNGLCRQCSAEVASVSRQKPTQARTAHRERLKARDKALSPRQWEFASRQRAHKDAQGPTSSWWTRKDFGAALDEQRSRFKAGGSE